MAKRGTKSKLRSSRKSPARPARPGGTFIPRAVWKAFEQSANRAWPSTPSQPTYSKAAARQLKQALTVGGEAALEELENNLRNDPMLLVHPLVWSLFQTWYAQETSFEGLILFDHWEEREWVFRLIRSWAEGVTLGKVTATKVPPARPPRSGAPARLFPLLKEKHGWVQSDAAGKQHFDATGFLHDFWSLHEKLKQAVQWKAYAEEQREDRERFLVHEIPQISETVKVEFDRYKEENSYKYRQIAQGELQQFVKKAFQDIEKGHGGRFWLTCCLLGTLEKYQRPDIPTAKMPSAIRETYKTVRKNFGKDSLELFRMAWGFKKPLKESALSKTRTTSPLKIIGQKLPRRSTR